HGDATEPALVGGLRDLCQRGAQRAGSARPDVVVELQAKFHRARPPNNRRADRVPHPAVRPPAPPPSDVAPKSAIRRLLRRSAGGIVFRLFSPNARRSPMHLSLEDALAQYLARPRRGTDAEAEERELRKFAAALGPAADVAALRPGQIEDYEKRFVPGWDGAT